MVWLILQTSCQQSITNEPPLSADEAARLNTKIGVSFVSLNGAPALSVTFRFVMPDRDSLAFQLPDAFLHKTMLYKHILGLQVLSNGRFEDVDGRPELKVLRHAPNQEVKITYVFARTPFGRGDYKDSFSSPVIRDDYFQFVGSMVFILPLVLRRLKSFSLDWTWDVPEGFNVFNSHGARSNHQRIFTNYEGILDGLFVAGDRLRTRQAMVRDHMVEVLIRGVFERISDEDFEKNIVSLIDVQRATFGDPASRYFLVSLFSFPSDCRHGLRTMGTAHVNSFRAFFPSGCAFVPETIQLVSHELFHAYNGKKIKVGKDRGHVDGKWFTEGFTDFYGRIFAYRAGLFSIEEYFKSFNKSLKRYYFSRDIWVTQQDIINRMYRPGLTSSELESIPYQRGEIMAWRLNKKIKMHTGFKASLDNVIMDMLKEANAAGGEKNFDVSEIEQIVDRYAPGEFAVEFSKIQEGGLFVPPTLGDCVSREENLMTARAPTKSYERYYYGNATKHSRNMCAKWLQGMSIK